MRPIFRICGNESQPGLQLGEKLVACENICFSLPFAAGDVSRETSPAAKSKEKRMFSQAKNPTFRIKKLKIQLSGYAGMKVSQAYN